MGDIMKKIELKMRDLVTISNLLNFQISQMENPMWDFCFGDKRPKEEIEAEREKMIADSKATEYYKDLKRLQDCIGDVPIEIEYNDIAD